MPAPPKKPRTENDFYTRKGREPISPTLVTTLDGTLKATGVHPRY
ncbi:MAG TPA: hypothetical protein VFF13_02425 [archaeon]|nr:hypothetical protein [archaeon]